MNKPCNNFKIWKIVESNCKILCISVFFFFVISIYSSSFFYVYNLCFLLTPLKNNPGAATEEDGKKMVNDVLDNVFEYLQILDYMGTTFPNWMISLSFTKLNLELLPPLGKLPLLKYLFISTVYVERSLFRELVRVGRTDWSILEEWEKKKKKKIMAAVLLL